MTPKDYFDQIVAPALRDFESDSRNRRLGYVACILLFHLKDYLAAAGEKNIEARMNKATSNQFLVLQGVCNGTKHVAATKGQQLKFQSGSDRDRPPAILGEMTLGVSRLGDSKGGIDVPLDQTPNGKHADLLQIVQECAAAYKNEFFSYL
ncbi:MAG: hypothetical protein R8J41_01060 [Alphaproteobacteria bacterium]|nr:hypothetical protein [Alphaproteobacteria bacterium]